MSLAAAVAALVVAFSDNAPSLIQITQHDLSSSERVCLEVRHAGWGGDHRIPRNDGQFMVVAKDIYPNDDARDRNAEIVPLSKPVHFQKIVLPKFYDRPSWLFVVRGKVWDSGIDGGVFWRRPCALDPAAFALEDNQAAEIGDMHISRGALTGVEQLEGELPAVFASYPKNVCEKVRTTSGLSVSVGDPIGSFHRSNLRFEPLFLLFRGQPLIVNLRLNLTQVAPEKQNAASANPRLNNGQKQQPKRPRRHVLLSLQIGLAALCILGGGYVLSYAVKAIRDPRRIDAGLIALVLGLFSFVGGGIVAAVNLLQLIGS